MNQSFKPITAQIRFGWPWGSLIVFCILIWSAATRAQTHEDPMFAAAMAYVDKKNWPKAEALLEFQLSQNASLHRARVELALVYAHQEKIQAALKNLDQVLTVEQLPENVRANVYRLRQRLSEQKKTPDERTEPLELVASVTKENDTGHQVKTHLEVAVGFDDNVRFSSYDYFLQDNPFQDGVFIDNGQGDLLYVAPDGFIYDSSGFPIARNNGIFDLGLEKPENVFYEYSIHFDHTYLFGNASGLKWYNGLHILASENAEFEEHNKFQVKLNTGFNWHLSEQLKADVELQHRLLKRNGQIQVRGTKFTPSMTYFNQWGSWELGFSWQRRAYENAIFTHGDFTSSFIGFETTNRSLFTKWSNLYLNNDLLVLGKVEIQDSNASDGLDNKGVKATAAMVYSFNDDWRWLFSVSRLLRDYNIMSSQNVSEPTSTPQGFINEKRKDRSMTFKTRLSYDIDRHWQVFLSGERGMRRSAIYNGITSDKTQFKLGVKLSF